MTPVSSRPSSFRLAGAALVALLSTPGLARQEAKHVGAPPSPSVSSGTREEILSSGSLCVGAIEDRASGGCLQASSTPLPGHLYPLGAEWMIDAAGRVGIGTTAPTEALDVQGTVQARTGGFRFPDGSLQPSAALPADVRPEMALGTVEFLGLSCPSAPAAIYSLTHSVARGVMSGTPIFTLSFLKDVDACSAAILSSAINGQLAGDVRLTIGAETITARQVLIVADDLTGDGRGVPREEVSVVFSRIDYDHQSGLSSGTFDLTTRVGSANPSFANQSLSFVVPAASPVPKSSYPALSTRLDWTGASGNELVVERLVDVANPSLFVACAAAHAITGLSAQVMRYDSSQGKEVPYLEHSLSGCRITSVSVDVDPLRGLRQTFRVAYTAAQWNFVIDGIQSSAP